MSVAADNDAGDDDRWKQKEYLYTVLNLPVYATEADIKERHRALSLIYHPDKQRDERTKDTAAKSFLEIQKAYEILSDPFLRQVYDTLGYEGLKLKIPDYFRGLPHQELIDALRGLMYSSATSLLESRVHSKGQISSSVDVRELFEGGWLAREWYTDLSERLQAVRVVSFGVRHSFQKALGPQTKAAIVGKMNQGLDEESVSEGSKSSLRLRGNVLGTLTHQYSPQIQFQASANLLRSHVMNLSGAYTSGGTGVEIGLPIMPRMRHMLPFPPIDVSVRRRLYRDSPIVGQLDFSISPRTPSVGLSIVKPALASKRDLVSLGWTYGLDLRLFGGGPRLHANWQFSFQKLGTAVQLGLQYTLVGLIGSLSGDWASDSGDTSISTTVGSSVQGVYLRLNVTHLGQSFVLPIYLSSEYSTGLTIFSAVLPTAAYVAWDYLVLRSRRERKRLARKQAQLRSRDDYVLERQKEASEAASLLKDTARRIRQAEKDRDGLVILEATYFPLGDDGEIIKDLGVDVTCPLQALVHNGQLFIPGGRPKSALRGFYDPLPDCRKVLAVRYDFNGRTHYAEVPDTGALLLPLESHLVETTDGDFESTC